MNRGFKSWNIDDNEPLDPTEFHNQQKEIEVALSSAFDDVSNLSDFTDSGDEYNTGDGHKKPSFENGANFNGNHLTASTPMRLKDASQHGKKLSEYRQNMSDVLEEDTSYLSESENHFKTCKDKTPFSEEEHNKYENDLDLDNYFNKEKISNSLLIENDKLSKQLLNLKRKCSSINTNYETLQDKFHQLFKDNKTNVETVEQLQLKIKSLESKLKEERLNNNILSKKNTFLEAQVDSLEDALNEHRKSDFISRTNDAQEKIIANLKQKHEKDITLLRNEIENLTHQLSEREEEILTKNELLEKYSEKSISDTVKQMMELFKKEIREQKDLESNKMSKDKSKLDELLQSFDHRITSLKEDWLQKLHEDVDKIINWISDNEKLDAQQMRAINVEFLPLKKLSNYLNKILTERNHKIEMQISQFRESKQQLEEALLESKISSSNLSNHSDKSQMLDELRGELDKFRQESQLLAHKLSKYKQHYRLLEKRHQQDIETLKSQFSAYVRNKQNKNPNN